MVKSPRRKKALCFADKQAFESIFRQQIVKLRRQSQDKSTLSQSTMQADGNYRNLLCRDLLTLLSAKIRQTQDATAVSDTRQTVALLHSANSLTATKHFHFKEGSLLPACHLNAAVS